MQKIIFLKYGELSTKKDNRNFFLKILHHNIQTVLPNVTIKYDFGRMFIMPTEAYFEEILDKLKKIFGIQEIVIGYISENREINNIANEINMLLKDKTFKTFKVEALRSDKNYEPNSMEIRKILGGLILKENPSLKVDLENPDIEINVEIRLKEVLIYFDQVKGIGGYPVSSLGKGLLMLSGGIDSPVAGFLAMKRGIKLEAIYFESPPHTSDEAKEKVKKLAQILALYNGELKLHIINFTAIQESIYKNVPHEYLITIMRRCMYRISAMVAKRKRISVIINGESIGQVASQTLKSMSVINEVVKIPVIRPVACFDKLEIIALAKKIGTYETSILPYEDCCTIFVPKHPVINPELSKCLEYETLFPYENLIYEAVKNMETIVVKPEKELEYQDYL